MGDSLHPLSSNAKYLTFHNQNDKSIDISIIDLNNEYSMLFVGNQWGACQWQENENKL